MELDDLLQCPVCYEVPAGHIFQCNEGHHVCGSCKARIDVCPVCRSLFFGTRNYAMEELISNIQKLKILVKPVQAPSSEPSAGSSGSELTESANTSLAVSDTGSPQESLPRPPRPLSAVSCRGLFRCLCCESGKTERLPVARMLNHLRYWHSHSLIEGKSERDQYTLAWQVPVQPGRIVVPVRVSDMGIFFLVAEITDDTLRAWVSMVASPWEAGNFKYHLTMAGNDREVFFVDCVWSVRSCEGQLKKRSRCLLIRNDNLRPLFTSSTMSVTLSIRRTDASEVLPAEPRTVLRVANRSSSDTGSTVSFDSPDRRQPPTPAPRAWGQQRAVPTPQSVRPPVVQPAQALAVVQNARIAAVRAARAAAGHSAPSSAAQPARAPEAQPAHALAAAQHTCVAAVRSARAAAGHSAPSSAAQPAGAPAPQSARVAAAQPAPQPAGAPAAQPAGDSTEPPAVQLSANARRRLRRRLRRSVPEVTAMEEIDPWADPSIIGRRATSSTNANGLPPVDRNEADIDSYEINNAIIDQIQLDQILAADESWMEARQPTDAHRFGRTTHRATRGRARR